MCLRPPSTVAFQPRSSPKCTARRDRCDGDSKGFQKTIASCPDAVCHLKDASASCDLLLQTTRGFASAPERVLGGETRFRFALAESREEGAPRKGNPQVPGKERAPPVWSPLAHFSVTVWCLCCCCTGVFVRRYRGR